MIWKAGLVKTDVSAEPGKILGPFCFTKQTGGRD
jgi:hypothetical protein